MKSQDDSNNEVAVSGCGEQIDDILDGLVGAVIAQDDSNNEVAVSGCGEQIDDILDVKQDDSNNEVTRRLQQ
jgi:hypothetical protein